MQIYGEQLNNAILADREQKKTQQKTSVNYYDHNAIINALFRMNI